jgi:recombination protein RecA
MPPMNAQVLVDSSCPRRPDLDVKGLRRGLAVPDVPAEWRLAAFAGRFAEVSGDEAGASLTLVFRLVYEAQSRGEPVAWVGRWESSFFPPDVADAGIDLAALPVVRTQDSLAAAGAADLLVRSGAFGLLVLDIGPRASLPLPAQTRLVGLAKQHDTALICVTEKNGDRPSLGSLISLRAHTGRARPERDRFRCEARVLKDKRRGPGWKHTEVCHGPDGLH